MIYLFSKTECGPCILVKKYFNALNDERTEKIKEILLDDNCSTETLDFAKRYNVTATPTLLVVDGIDGEVVSEYVGGVPITQNINNIMDKYA